MSFPLKQPAAIRTAAAGAFALAAAMGIGRFAFTPVMPLMQAGGLISLRDGAHLATANYIGYFLGALACVALTPSAARATRYGLLAVAVSTIAMAFTHSIAPWLLLRFIAGVSSAYVLVGITAWGLNALAHAGRPQLAGWLFTGVGFGIFLVGLGSLAIDASGLSSPTAWLILGIAAFAISLFPLLTVAQPAGKRGPVTFAAAPLRRAHILPIVCYGCFGFGYIIPATFLPAAARALFNDPLIFGWVWPVFGLTAAASTVVAAAVMAWLGPRRTWAYAQIVLALGVVLPVIYPGLVSLLASAIFVGGTFMVITMAGFQEGKRITTGSATRLVAAMTAAFAAGQLLGPLIVFDHGSAAEAIRIPSFLAGALLLVSGLALLLADNGLSPRTTP